MAATGAFPAELLRGQPEDPVAPEELGAYRARGGYAAWPGLPDDPEALLARLERAGLAGRGGAQFPAHRKLRAVREAAAAEKCLVVNGSEHEPGSIKDRMLLARLPHQVLEGALVAAGLVGAGRVTFAVNAGAPAALEGIGAAVEAWRGAFPEAAGVMLSILTVPDDYLVGEETAVLEVLEGREALPRERPPYPSQRGLGGRPTLVHNVETLAWLPLLLLGGDEIPAASLLCSLGAEFAKPGLHEVALGTPLRHLLFEVGGGLAEGGTLQAVQIGGPASAFLTEAQFDLPLEQEALRAVGSSLGCGVVRGYPADACMVAEIAGILAFLAEASCGQCPECRMETGMCLQILRQLQAGRAKPALLARIPAIFEMVAGKGRCGLIAMPQAPLTSGLEAFEATVAAHLNGQDCPVCRRDLERLAR